MQPAEKEDHLADLCRPEDGLSLINEARPRLRSQNAEDDLSAGARRPARRPRLVYIQVPRRPPRSRPCALAPAVRDVDLGDLVRLPASSSSSARPAGARPAPLQRSSARFVERRAPAARPAQAQRNPPAMLADIPGASRPYRSADASTARTSAVAWRLRARQFTVAAPDRSASRSRWEPTSSCRRRSSVPPARASPGRPLVQASAVAGRRQQMAGRRRGSVS